MTCWVGNASKQDENSLDNETKKAGGEGGGRRESTDTAYHRLVTNKLRSNLSDETQPLRPGFHSRHKSD